MEIAFGKDGGQSFILNGSDGNVEGTSRIWPFLTGIRYDWLPAKYESIIQPYFSGGFGFYWVMKSLVNGPFGEEDVVDESKMKAGIYLGTGTHVVLTSWFALNFDLKYHFINLHPTKEYSGIQLGAGVCFLLGSKKEIFRVEDIKVIVKDVYPVYYQFYNTYPLVLVSVKNTTNYPIEMNIQSNIQGYSEGRCESGIVKIEPGEVKDIPVFAVFGSNLMKNTNRVPATIDLHLEARAGGMHKKSFTTEIMIHNRNAWNGEIDKLGFFVTPDDEYIMGIGRRIELQVTEDSVMSTKNFWTARALFNELKAFGIRYHSDPNILFYRDDRVQFADETLRLGGGDCDDLVVLYSSLLESIGIESAFLDVHDPRKNVAHVYLMFDTGLTPEKGHLLSSNDKRFVIREDPSGKSTIWIPVETTLVESGFEEAWKGGALQYLQEGIVRNGLSEGWVKIIDID